MIQASKLQRFGAFVIDMLLIILVGTIISNFIESSITIPTLTTEAYDAMSSDLQIYYDSLSDTSFFNFVASLYESNNETLINDFAIWLTTTEGTNYYSSVTNALMLMYGLELLAYTIIVFLYLVVLPYFWDKQTLGRLVVKCKVAYGEDFEKPSFGKFFIREVIGGELINFFNCCCGIIAILNVAFIFSKNQTIADMISGTTFVRYDDKAKELLEKKREEILNNHPEFNNGNFESNINNQKEEVKIVVDPDDIFKDDKNE